MRYGLRDEGCSIKKLSQLIQTLVKDFHWEQFEHPPYSPDLVLSDYHLFLRLNKELRGQCFQIREELIKLSRIFARNWGKIFISKE